MAGEDDDYAERPLVLRLLKRARAVIVLVPLLAGVLVAASIGAGMLWADPPERPVPEAEVRCWDRSVATVSQCPEPDGVAGLRWVFPALDPADEECRRAHRGLALTCTVPLEGDDVRITYRRETGLDEGLARIGDRYRGVEPDGDAGVLVYRARRPDGGRWSLTATYQEHPFSVTVEAATARLRDLALDDSVEMRRAPKVTVRSTDAG